MAATVDRTRVRVEDGSSMGRSYTASSNKRAGLGAERRGLTTKSFNIDDDKLVLDSLPAPNLNTSTKADILAYFLNSYDLNSSLFALLKNDSVFYMKPDVLRRPLIFYFAHTCSVYANKLALAGVIDDIDPYYQKMFETGVDEMSWDDMDDMQDDDYAWPTVAESEAFRQRVKAAVVEVINAMPDPKEVPITMDSPYWGLIMGFEHERIHLETSSVLIRQLPIDCVRKPVTWRDCPFRASTPAEVPKNKLQDVDATRVVLGKPCDFPQYGWDNEYGKRVVDVPAFAGSRFKVTNAEFLPFVLAGGYRDRKWWVSPRGDDEGWRWASYRNATHPSFWVATAAMPDFIGGTPELPYQKDDGHARAGTGTEFMLRVELDIVPMPWDWPVEVNYHEARAFLNWKAANEGLAPGQLRMPTEAEFHAMRDDPCPFPEALTGKRFAGQRAGIPADPEAAERMVATADAVKAPPATVPDFGAPAPVDASIEHPAYQEDPAAFDVVMNPVCPGNTNMKFHSPSPVHLYPPSTAGFYDTHGNVWEYVEDHFAGLPDFSIHYLYDDFSTPCFDGWHTMMLGGSWVSTGDESSNFGRYAFRRHFFQQLGFRYVRTTAGTKEDFPGQATVKNLWEGMGDISQQVTDGYATAADKLAVVGDAPAVSALGAITLADASTFPRRLADAVATLYAKAKAPAAAAAADASVLHLNCGAGGVTMQLCRHFSNVVGTHHVEPVLRQARLLQHHGQLEYQRLTEGILTTTALVNVDRDIDRSRAVYVETCVSELEPALKANGGKPFDAVVLDGALTQVTQPLDALKSLRKAGVVAEGGVVVVLSDHSWNADVTPRNSWLGGFNMNGEEVTTRDSIVRHLGSRGLYEFVEAADVPVLRCQDARRFTLELIDAVALRKGAEAPPRAAAAAAAAESACA
ncbi:hypothetical protein FNF27_03067 [Cafeteria roenbergensis]|uniref:Sulfatase-modifying factor enzyme-like domain-containing protein n=1 Tax=Cafeteria roenbergensis TaxID=33653 RepID=A0A5A8EBY5_CAFRO|nr:hypothetical protein FNF27_03067 [Cafeteria roenbergensis]